MTARYDPFERSAFSFSVSRILDTLFVAPSLTTWLQSAANLTSSATAGGAWDSTAQAATAALHSDYNAYVLEVLARAGVTHFVNCSRTARPLSSAPHILENTLFLSAIESPPVPQRTSPPLSAPSPFDVV